MKLDRKKMLLISFMLFSLFFGAGNLIFPPFLGQNAGSSTVSAMLGFLATAVILPVLGVIVVARFDGLEQLAQHAGKKFSLIFTVLIYLSIGPGLGIPRAASVPFEMAVAPYLPQGANIRVWMVVYSLVFFLIALWLCMTPGKLVSRIGNFLTPSLLILLVFLFISFLFRGQVNIAAPQTEYSAAPFLKGFSEGYQTMDTIAARLSDCHDAGQLRADAAQGCTAPHGQGWAFRRIDSLRRLHDAQLHGHVLLRRVRHSGERCVDAAVHRFPAFRRTRRVSARRHLHARLPDDVCRAD